ncbi:toll/interleukin-1 receptor domain-containing protein [Hirschia litorea]|uniref:Toll/interleukin-1 receptor domain-containing protein n=1 Tax=Hirschia litorea TaxID=1199156 RepID=A0ABW2ILE2_9PROT
MADIFISYKKEDAGRVVRIVEGLRAEGFSVWWDHGIAPGSQWDQTIQKELNEAKMVVAVWSDLSVTAPWVKEEAGVGKTRGNLLPVRIDDVAPPLGFGLIQMANLIDWDGDKDDQHWVHFLAAAKATLSGNPVIGLERPVKHTSKFVKMLPILALLALVVGAGGYALFKLDGKSGTGSSSNTIITNTKNQDNSTPSESETALFEKAQDSTLKADYLDYLKIYSQGAFATKIREDILPFCSFEQRDKWMPVPQPAGQMIRATSDTSVYDLEKQVFTSREDACFMAQSNFERQVDKLCQNFASNPNSRNPQLTINHADKCDCQEFNGEWMCFTDSTYACTWEMKSFENIEVCK